MGFLNDLIKRAQSALSSLQAAPEKYTDAVRHTRFDAMIFDELLEEAPALTDLVERLNQDWDYTDDMVRDVLMEFWQGDPQMRSSEEMRPGWLTNRAVADHVQSSPDTEATRSYTVHDRYSAAMATLAVSEEVEEFLRRHREEQEQAQEAAEQAEQAASQQEAAQEALNDALQDAQAEGWPEVGPPSPAQTSAAEALADALDTALSAQQAAQASAQQAQQAHEEATQALRTPVQQGVAEAHKQLDEEAALMHAWGQEPGSLQRLSFAERARLAERLRTNRLGKFAQLIGRFRMMVAAQQTKKVEYGRDEVVGVELSGDLTRLVPVELVNLAVPELRLDFMQRMVEGRLLSRRYRGTEKVGKGAIIAAIDCSGSMEGVDSNGIPREAWAKALALALLDQAKRSSRDFVAILFSSHRQQRVIEFPKGRGSLDQVLELAEHFYGGGTDFMAPMDLAMHKLEAEYNDAGKMKGDIVFVTDDACRVSPDWMTTYQTRKAKLGFRTFGIQIGPTSPWGGGNDSLRAMSDNVRQVEEFADPGTVADIFRVVE